jgi:hypothetical protein
MKKLTLVATTSNVKASMPWVKCIPSVGTLANDDKIKLSKDKIPKLQSAAASPNPPTPPSNPKETVVIDDDDDDLEGMPILTPVDISSPQPSSSSQVSF